LGSRNVILVAYHFPPSGAAGAVRPGRWAQHLGDHGWEPAVLTTRHKAVGGGPRGFDGVQVTASELPHPLDAYRGAKRLFQRRSGQDPVREQRRYTGALPQSRLRRIIRNVGALLGLPDRHLGWFPGAVMVGRRLIRDSSPSAIVSTAPPWTVHLVALALARLSGLPWLCDFRDPWFTGLDGSPQEKTHGRWLLERLEGWVFARADRIVVTNPRFASVLRRRDPTTAARVRVIMSGLDTARLNDSRQRMSGRLTIVHAGTLYRWREPGPLLATVAELLERGLMDRQRVRLRFIGAMERFEGDFLLEDQVERLGLGDVVELPGELPREQIRAELADSSLNLLLAQRYPIQLPMKTFEYLASGVPMLVVADAGATTDLLSDYDRATIVHPDDRDGLRRALLTAYEAEMAYDSHSPSPLTAEDLRRFEIRDRVAELAALLNEVVDA